MQLHRQRNKLTYLNAAVLLLTFASEPQARNWRVETHVDFPLLRDAERQVYRAYGLESSHLRSWQPKVWAQYARLMLLGRAWRGVQGDSAQLGGDFVVDRRGILRLAYRSQDPTDRPSAALLLAEVERAARL